MHYYHVWVRSEMYRGDEPLTYFYPEVIAAGSVVTVPLRDTQVLGFVSNEVAQPRFALKPIAGILQLPALPGNSVKLAAWLAMYYAAPIGVVTQLFLPDRLRQKPSADRNINYAGGAPDTNPLPALTTPQTEVISRIDRPDTYLLHGRTGSGKTRIYIELCKRTFSQHRSALILTPEIGLTSQLELAFRKSFDQRVVVLHSGLQRSEREQAWTNILTSTRPLVVIGPRSAIFSPLADVGLIVVDEAHDDAYKQADAPYYHASRVASKLRQLTGATLVLGSATPSIADYYLATKKRKSILRLDQLAVSSNAKREIAIVDLKDRAQFSRSRHISSKLAESIDTSISNHQLSLLYLNRRGTARLSMCTNCGWQALCPNCDLPLTYHGDDFLLRCHICGFKRRPDLSCPVCGMQSLELHSFGTKAIAEEVAKLFPGARILRLDTDNKRSERLDVQYAKILAGRYDVLVGTQLLAKGLDLPRLSTLGVILADSSLYVPDYTAHERTYQLLTQVIGRVGRGHIDGRVIVQTYYPKSKLIADALHDNWQSFYRDEISERSQYFFPPFCYLLKVSCRRSSPESADRALTKFKQSISDHGSVISTEGPAPAFHEKSGGLYKWQLVVKARDRSKLLEIARKLPNNCSYDIDPSDLL